MPPIPPPPPCVFEAGATTSPAESQPHRTRLIVAGEWLLLAIVIGYFGVRTLPRAWQVLNTDFPNYYLTARLLREGHKTDRIYEWIWMQRQKDHFSIDQPVVGFAPLTPVSSLVVWPLTFLPPLAAKHAWIVVNLILLIVIAVLLHSITAAALGWRRIALLVLLNLSMHRNLQYGQYYIVLLFLLTLSLWLYLRQRQGVAGVLVGIAFSLKIFPLLFLFYFARKRDVKAILGVIGGSLAAVLLSIAVFGLQLNRTYAVQVLPSALRGEVLDPYNLAANSFSALLHRLFVFEPDWNPHPVLQAPALLAILHPLLQIMIFAPVLLLVSSKVSSKDARSEQIRLEWAAFLLAVMTISTMPASYHFTLLILPVIVMSAALMKTESYGALALLIAAYLAICFPAWKTNLGDGWLALLSVPRLYLLLLLCLGSFWLMSKRRLGYTTIFGRGEKVWCAAFGCGVLLLLALALRHQRGVYDYRWRIPTAKGAFLVTNPVVQDRSLLFIAMFTDGYHSGEQRFGENAFPDNTSPEYISSGQRVDRLAQTAAGGLRWTEESGLQSRIVVGDAVAKAKPPYAAINNADSPVASQDGKWLAFLRADRGSSRLWIHSVQSEGVHDRPLTPVNIEVLEMSFLPDDRIIVAGSADGVTRLYVVDLEGNLQASGAGIPSATARYPAVSPDGRWLVYSGLLGGNWNLWLHDLHTQRTQRITNAACNDLAPAWNADSKTIVYASDCGRGYWLTALCRRQIIP